MSDALEKARENILGVDLSDMSRAREGLIDALTSEFGPAYIVEHIELFVTAVINNRNPVAIIECEDCNARVLDFNAPQAILDAREAKAAPDDGGGAQTKAMVGRLDREISRMDALVATKDARIAELERERDEAQASLNDTIQRMQDLCERHGCPGGVNRFTFIDARLTSGKTAQAALAELRGRVEKARTLLASEYGPGRIFCIDNAEDEGFRVFRVVNEALALLTDPEAKEGGGPDSRRDSAEREHIAKPARDTDPVPATDSDGLPLPPAPKTDYVGVVSSPRREAAIRALVKALERAYGGLSSPEIIKEVDDALAAHAAALAAGITGKGTSDD
jgi:hypothetical protein